MDSKIRIGKGQTSKGFGIYAKLRSFVRFAMELGVANAVAIVWQKMIRRQVLKLRISGIKHPVYSRSGDLYVLQEVFGRISGRVYEPSLTGIPKLIIDAGANVGFASAMFASRYPMARIVSIEPDPANCEMFKMTCGRYPHVRLVQRALWFRHGWVTIENPDDASFLFRVTESVDSASGIATVTIPEILAEEDAERIDILKLDIEGGEKRLFSQNGDWLRKVRVIIAELHDQYVSGCSEALFAAIGSRRFLHSRVNGLDLVVFLDT